MRRLLREPLLHFLVLGAILFALYARVGGGGEEAPDQIVVDGPRVEGLAAQFERVWQRPPTPEELRGLVDGFVREEILYREGLALRLDRDDPVIRRRVGQKMGFLADAQADAEVTDADLQAWLDAHPDSYRVEPRTTLRQLYFDPAKRGARLGADLAAAREALAKGAGEALAKGSREPGDPTLLPATLESAPTSELARVFGDAFAEAVAALPVGGWHGPVASSYGAHLVEVRAREPGRTPALAEVRAAVERDLLRARADEASEAFYRALRERYTVRIEVAPERAQATGAAGAGPEAAPAQSPSARAAGGAPRMAEAR
jgi:hypothetical protein